MRSGLILQCLVGDRLLSLLDLELDTDLTCTRHTAVMTRHPHHPPSLLYCLIPPPLPPFLSFVLFCPLIPLLYLYLYLYLNLYLNPYLYFCIYIYLHIHPHEFEHAFAYAFAFAHAHAHCSSAARRRRTEVERSSCMCGVCVWVDVDVCNANAQNIMYVMFDTETRK